MRKRITKTVFVEFDADIELIELFHHARRLNPDALQWVRSIRSVPIGTDRVRMTVGIFRDHYVSVLAGMDGILEYVPLAIEQELLIDALHVVDELDAVADQKGEGAPIVASTPESFSASYDDDWQIPF
jgi:hypothetical protein